MSVTAEQAHLVVPDVRWHASLLAATAEHDPSHAVLVPSTAWELTTDWVDPAVFARWVAALRADSLPATARPAGRVPTSERWWVRGDTFLGRVSIRHWLTPALRRDGGNLGYAVRPSARGRGHATAMVGAARVVLSELGIDPALVTVHVDNRASRRVVEANGGVRVDVRDDMVRYHVPAATGGQRSRDGGR